MVTVCAGEAIAVAAQTTNTVQVFFHALSFVIGNLRGARSNRGLLAREKRVSPAVRPRGGGTMRPCRAQPLSSGRAVKGQSCLSCVPTVQASVESNVSKSAKRGEPGSLA